jgi:hypothetical protein
VCGGDLVGGRAAGGGRAETINRFCAFSSRARNGSYFLAGAEFETF